MSPAPPGRAGYRQAVASEWTKLRSLRSATGLLAATGLVMPVLAAFVALTGSLQPDDTVVGASLTGAVLAQVLATALGAAIATGEYRSGLIRTTLAACPRRATVLAAKATVAALAVLLVAWVGAAAAFAVGLSLLDVDAHPSGEPFSAVVGVAACLAVSAVLGVAVGTVVRHTAGAVAAIVGVLLVPGFLGPLLGGAGRWLGGASPAGVLQKLTQTSDASPEAVGSVAAWPSLAALALVVAVVLGAAARALQRRDA